MRRRWRRRGKAAEKGRRKGRLQRRGRRGRLQRGEGVEGCRESEGGEGCREREGGEGCREGEGGEGCRESEGGEGCREREGGEGCREGEGGEGCREGEGGEGCREREGGEGCREREGGETAEKGKEGKAAEKGKEGKAAEKGKEGKAVEKGRRRGRLWRRGKESVSVAQSHVLRRETITAGLERVRHLLHKLLCLCTHHPAEVVYLICLVCSPNTSLSCLLAKHEQWKFLEGEKKHHNMRLFFLQCLPYYIYHNYYGRQCRKNNGLMGHDGSLASKGYLCMK